ncbi:MAG: hypothetical protein ACN6PM_04040 [Achromobacter mucicolens]|uniref:hypothetical protein n=1 Tax=Achromobacter mucicolens TaxID=1389922 RepID=UPI003D12EAB7
MLFESVSLVLKQHAPDVTSALLSAEVRDYEEIREQSKQPETRPIPETKAPPRWVFPPYRFRFSVGANEAGYVTSYDDLASGESLVCIPYSFDGNFHRYDAEAFAAAWAYLVSTPRRVLARPSFESLFAAPTSFVEYISQLFGAVLAPSESRLTPDIEFLACAGQIWTCYETRDRACAIFERIEQTVADRLDIPADVLAHFEIEFRPDQTLHLRFSPFVPQHLFLSQRARIMRAMIASSIVTERQT